MPDLIQERNLPHIAANKGSEGVAHKEDCPDCSPLCEKCACMLKFYPHIKYLGFGISRSDVP